MNETRPLRGPFQHYGGYAWRADGSFLAPGDSARAPFNSEVLLREDANALYGAHAAHDAVRSWGRGLYSHWESSLIFSTSDNSDPNSNGRTYSLNDGFALEAWDRERWRSGTARWSLHPKADTFLQRGGADIPPPVYCNLALTNKCNLRCEICGSQKHLDETGVKRRHMDYGLFEKVAETLFPFIYEVELNSQGDPLLHPRIADVLSAIARHDCNVKIQTNGTLFSDRIIELLARHFGFVMLSLDAVGARFDEVRQGGKWKEAEPQLRKFLAARDPRRLRVGIYPTLTRRTVGEALKVVQWASDHGVDEVSFHSYVPIRNSFEEVPSPDELSGAVEALRSWLSVQGEVLEIQVNGAPLNGAPVRERRTQFASALKRQLALQPVGPGNMFPVSARMPYADPASICVSPRAYVEIGLDGQISACCRAQDVSLGYATSVEDFADAWFGRNYSLIRESLKRTASGDLPLENCGACIAQHAPDALAGRGARNALDFSHLAYVRLEAIQREFKHCHIAPLPLGIDPEAFALYEDEVALGPPKQMHDDVRLLGGGRYSIWGQALYFSASDNSDARINGRSYALRRIPTTRVDKLPSSGFELSLIATQYRATELHAFFARLNRDVSMLHADVLALLYHCARHAAGPLLELGPFTGGATIAMARGLADAASGLKLISVELGGSSDHVTYATPDIVASFRSNLGEHGLSAHCELVVGHSRDAAVVAEVARLAGSARFGCLVIDADGHAEEDIRLYGPLLSPGALLVVDDYYSSGAPEKEVITRRDIDQLVERGVLEAFGVHGWGTWFGRLL